jgi:hypothetical protein
MTHRPIGDSRERDAIRQVAERLARQYPELPSGEVEQAVYRAYGTFDESPVRDFVPVLVERASRRELTEQRRREQPA